MDILQIHHVSVIVSSTRKSLAFYCGVLGLTQSDKRPELGFPGAWLQVGGQQIHLLELSNPDPVTGRPEHGGRDRHIALVVDDLERVRARLDDAKIIYQPSHSGRKALFCRDPDGNGIELLANPG